MKSLEEIEKILKDQKPYLMEHYHISELGVFGSYVRGEQTEDSDVDVLIEFSELPDLITYDEIERYLGSLLGNKVDLVEREGLKPRIGRQILSEVIYL